MTRIAVIGLGYIGLPTAAVLALRGFDVLGMDVILLLVDHQHFAAIPTEYDLTEMAVIDTRGQWKG